MTQRRKQPDDRPRTKRGGTPRPEPTPSAAPETGQEQQLKDLREISERLMIASVHQQELAERAQRQAAQWNALVESLTEGVIVVDRGGQMVVANPIARALLEMPSQGDLTYARDWLGVDFRRPDGRPLRPEDRPLARALQGERFNNYEVQLIHHDGSAGRVVFNGSAVKDERGEIELTILTFRDVTELRQLERVKEEYVSLISHDLRLPLTVILGRVQLLCRLAAEPGFAVVEEHATAILSNARRMHAMIQDLLEVSRLEGGRIALRRQTGDLLAMVSAVVDSLPSAEDRSRIHVESPVPLPTVRLDRERIERVIVNLVTNALKFSAAGTPVEVRLEPRAHEVIVSVADHGPGIPPDAMPHLFEKYYRAPGAPARDGLGLGLYISKLIVEASGGQIWATSQVGQGSTFCFSLPID